MNLSNKSSKFKTLNDGILTVALEREGDNNKEIEIEEKTSDEFDLNSRTNLISIEDFIPFLKL